LKARGNHTSTKSTTAFTFMITEAQRASFVNFVRPSAKCTRANTRVKPLWPVAARLKGNKRYGASARFYFGNKLGKRRQMR
jgi:hypothetical protein